MDWPKTVAEGSRRSWLAPHVPHNPLLRVWKVQLVPRSFSPNCLARVFATNRRNTVPVAMPQTPPFRFSRAVMVAVMNARKTSTGTVARAKSSATFVRSNNVSLSSKCKRRVFLEHPPGPGELPHTNTLRIAWRPTAIPSRE